MTDFATQRARATAVTVAYRQRVDGAAHCRDLIEALKAAT